MKRKLFVLTALAAYYLTRKGIRKLNAENEKQPNQPKFNVGDYVKIHGIPTAYRIDSVETFDEYIAYHLEGTPDTSLYGEDVLEAIVDPNDDPGEYIIPLFDVGDTVQIDGTPEVYRIIGAFPEMIYALQDVQTNEIIDMDECVLKAFDGEVSNEITQKQTEVSEMAKEERKLTPREESSREAERRKNARKQKAADIDNLLDIAFWNRKQYEATGDETFTEKEREQYAKIKKLQAE